MRKDENAQFTKNQKSEFDRWFTKSERTPYETSLVHYEIFNVECAAYFLSPDLIMQFYCNKTEDTS